MRELVCYISALLLKMCLPSKRLEGNTKLSLRTPIDGLYSNGLRRTSGASYKNYIRLLQMKRKERRDDGPLALRGATTVEGGPCTLNSNNGGQAMKGMGYYVRLAAASGSVPGAVKVMVDSVRDISVASTPILESSVRTALTLSSAIGVGKVQVNCMVRV